MPQKTQTHTTIAALTKATYPSYQYFACSVHFTTINKSVFKHKNIQLNADT
jgi:hypothetical protein